MPELLSSSFLVRCSSFKPGLGFYGTVVFWFGAVRKTVEAHFFKFKVESGAQSCHGEVGFSAKSLGVRIGVQIFRLKIFRSQLTSIVEGNNFGVGF